MKNVASRYNPGSVLRYYNQQAGDNQQQHRAGDAGGSGLLDCLLISPQVVSWPWRHNIEYVDWSQ